MLVRVLVHRCHRWIRLLIAIPEGQTALQLFYKVSRNHITLYLPKMIYNACKCEDVYVYEGMPPRLTMLPTGTIDYLTKTRIAGMRKLHLSCWPG